MATLTCEPMALTALRRPLPNLRHQCRLAAGEAAQPGESERPRAACVNHQNAGAWHFDTSPGRGLLACCAGPTFGGWRGHWGRDRLCVKTTRAFGRHVVRVLLSLLAGAATCGVVTS